MTSKDIGLFLASDAFNDNFFWIMLGIIVLMAPQPIFALFGLIQYPWDRRRPKQ